MPRKTHKPPKKKKPAPAPPWRWWLVEFTLTTSGRYRMSGNLYPWYWLRLVSMIGSVEVLSQWRVTDVPVDRPLKVLVRSPGWALGVHAGFGLAEVTSLVTPEVTDCGTTDPRPKAADLDNPLYNVETIFL